MDQRSRDTETVEPAAKTPYSAGSVAEGSVVGGRYEILARLGSGGSAVVYKARDLALGKEIALKVLRPDRMSDVSLKRFRRELAIARDIRSPHVIPMWDIGEDEGRVWISMELAKGETLRERLMRGPMDIAEAIRISCDVLKAIDALHAGHVVHRDIKPSNVIIGPNGTARLGDLGLARRWDIAASSATDGLVGTYEYVSPEQALGQELDGRSDLYGFGVTLFEMLTQRVPFEASSSIGAVIAHINDQAPDVRELRPEAPEWLAAFVARLLEKDRRRRYSSASDALADLSARRIRPWYVLHRKKVGIAAAVLLLLLSAGAVRVWKTWTGSRFAGIVRANPMGFQAFDHDGRVLWSNDRATPPHRAVVARLGRNGPISIVAIDTADRNLDPIATHRLTIYDAQTGHIARTVTLPDCASVFGGFSNEYVPVQMDAVDLFHDGHDEIVISYVHSRYPSYAILWDPMRGSPRAILLASGHHRLVGTADVDGDGRDEMIFVGTASRMGGYTGVGAVSAIEPPTAPSIAATSWARAASTPDIDQRGTPPGALRWYALAPVAANDELRAPRIDHAGRVIRLFGRTGPQTRIGFDGFLVGSRSPLHGAAREAIREDAYAKLRQADQMTATNRDAQALEIIVAAKNEALRAGDELLAAWSARKQVQVLIALGHDAQAETLLPEVMRESQAQADTALDAARAWHLRGEISRAVTWYRNGLAEATRTHGSERLHDELLEGLVLALGEMGRWTEAKTAVNELSTAFGDDGGDSASDNAYIDWRTGIRSSAPVTTPSNAGDFHRYLALEVVASASHDAGSLLRRIDGEIGRVSGPTAMLRSLRAEVLLRMGRTSEALDDARVAWRDGLEARKRDIEVRALFDVITRRYERAAMLAGRPTEAAEAHRRYTEVRWRER